jgi:hypothetical protein
MYSSLQNYEGLFPFLTEKLKKINKFLNVCYFFHQNIHYTRESQSNDRYGWELMTHPILWRNERRVATVVLGEKRV